MIQNHLIKLINSIKIFLKTYRLTGKISFLLINLTALDMDQLLDIIFLKVINITQKKPLRVNLNNVVFCTKSLLLQSLISNSFRINYYYKFINLNSIENLILRLHDIIY